MLQYLLFLWMGVGLTGMYLAGHVRWGWLVAFVFNVGWVTYALSINEYALATQNCLFGLIALRNFHINKVC